LVSLIGLVILAYGLFYGFFAKDILDLVVDLMLAIAGGVLLWLGGLWQKGAEAKWEAEFPSQPEEDEGD
jgi:uncharacterized membrane protein